MKKARASNKEAPKTTFFPLKKIKIQLQKIRVYAV
jgi:hypothetical protein